MLFLGREEQGCKLHNQPYARGGRPPWGQSLAPVLPIAGHLGLSAFGDLLYLATHSVAHFFSYQAISPFLLPKNVPSSLLACLTLRLPGQVLSEFLKTWPIAG